VRPSKAERRAQSAAKLLVLVRLVLAVLSICVILIREGGWPPLSFQARAPYFVFVGACFLNLGYLLVLRWTRAYRAMDIVQLCVDVVLVSVLVHYTQGVDSAFVFLYFALILAASTVLGAKGGYLFAGLCGAGLASSAGLYFLGFAPDPGWMSAAQLRPAAGFLFAQLTGFGAVAFLSGSLMKRLSMVRIMSDEILEAIGQGILAVDRYGRIVFANSEARKMLSSGLRPGERLEDALPGAAWKENLIELAHREPPASAELSIRAENGRTFPLRLTSAGVPPTGERGVIVVLTDTTLEKQVEEAVKRAERFEAISEMAASIAHELRNPLASIRGSVQEIGRGLELPPERGELLQLVISESDRLDSIIREFLDFARMRPVRKAPADLSDILRDAAAITERSAGRKGVRFEADSPASMPISADAGQLRQVFLNLGVNALAALDGEGVVRVAARSARRGEFLPGAGVPDDEGYLVEVADDGRGMTDEVRKRAFDPFFTTKGAGTGLGLSIVQRTVRAHGGEVSIESEPGRGATVSVWLPRE